MHKLLVLTLCLTLSFLTFRAEAFCGFYVAKGDASLFNKTSQVVLVRNGEKTALTMFADYKGELSDFALVVPVPAVLAREQINVGERALIDRIDSFSAPRLVEFFDQDPCNPVYPDGGMRMRSTKWEAPTKKGKQADKAYGVTIEAKYTVGEYDILILDAKQSDGLEAWLKDNGYKLPSGASKALEPYIKQNLKFFVAKVNLKEQAKTGFSFLRPLQFAYESPRFMLPIRLGMVNADGPQDMIVYAISPKGRVETTNYRTVSLPTGLNVPEYIKNEFPDFYRAVFKTTWEKENKKVVLQEYAWNMGWCDPCAADPLSSDELRKLGVFWVKGSGAPVAPPPRKGVSIRKYQVRPSFVQNGPVDAFVTRLHVRYDREHFPEDLMFQETADSNNYQGRYVINHPWTAPLSCEAGATYTADLKRRLNDEVENVARLTGWPADEIRKKVKSTVPKTGDANWYKDIFK